MRACVRDKARARARVRPYRPYHRARACMARARARLYSTQGRGCARTTAPVPPPGRWWPVPPRRWYGCARTTGAPVPPRRACHTRASHAPSTHPPGNATKRCEFYWVCPGAPTATGGLRPRARAGAASARGRRRRRGRRARPWPGKRVAHDDAQAELAVACDDNARDPRGVRAQPPPVGEAEQGVGEGAMPT